MSRLKNTHELKQDVSKLEDSELKAAINLWIDKNEVYGIDSRFSNLIFRQNLHYILDNINKPGLIKELQF